MWIIKIVEVLTEINLKQFGIIPHSFDKIFGIILFPILHENFGHLFSNSVPLILIGFAVNYFYPTSAKKLWLSVYFIPGVFIWLFGRSGIHIGASGIVYGLWSFVFFSGIIRRDKRAIALSLLALFIYGGIVVGIFPIKKSMSWEGHFAGFITGLILAILFRKNDSYKQYDWEDEPRSNEKLEVSYDKDFSKEEKNEISH
ncbi:MAG: hypothetical protein Fur0015_08430 [Ignavibacteriales bacterium]